MKSDHTSEEIAQEFERFVLWVKENHGTFAMFRTEIDEYLDSVIEKYGMMK